MLTERQRNYAPGGKWYRHSTADVRRWMERNPEKVKIQRAKARAKNHRRSVKERVSEAALQARLTYYGFKCYLCGEPWQEWDHVIPLARGGLNLPANLRPACGPCNRAKGTKRLSEVMENVAQ